MTVAANRPRPCPHCPACDDHINCPWLKCQVGQCREVFKPTVYNAAGRPVGTL